MKSKLFILFIISVSFELRAQSLIDRMLFDSLNSGVSVNSQFVNRKNELVLSFVGTGSPSGVIIKIDSLGKLLFSKQIFVQSSNSNYRLENVLQTSDDAYLFAVSLHASGSIYALIKTDTNFNVLWHKKYSHLYSGSLNQPFLKDVELNDKGIILYHSLNLYQPKISALEITKVDSIGNPVWSKYIDDSTTTGYSWHRSISTKDGGFILSSKLIDASCIIKFNNLGNVDWAKKIKDNIYINSIIEDDSTNGFFFAGSRCCTGGHWTPLVFSMDKNGAILKSKIFDSDDGGFVSIKKISNGNYLTASYVEKNIDSPRKDCLTNFTPDLDTIWTSSFMGTYGYNIFPNHKGMVVISNQNNLLSFIQFDSLGHRNCNEINVVNSIQDQSLVTSNYNYFIKSDTIVVDTILSVNYSPFLFSKLDYCQYTSLNEFVKEDSEVLIIYPNPNHGLFSIEIPDLFYNNCCVTISIFDFKGSIVYHEIINSNPNRKVLVLDKLSKGLYNVILTNGSKNYSGKIILE